MPDVYEVFHDRKDRKLHIRKNKGPEYTIDTHDLTNLAFERYRTTGIQMKGIEGNEEWVYQQAVRESQYVDFEPVIKAELCQQVDPRT